MPAQTGNAPMFQSSAMMEIIAQRTIAPTEHVFMCRAPVQIRTPARTTSACWDSAKIFLWIAMTRIPALQIIARMEFANTRTSVIQPIPALVLCAAMQTPALPIPASAAPAIT
jgi:hypothetical protein